MTDKTERSGGVKPSSDRHVSKQALEPKKPLRSLQTLGDESGDGGFSIQSQFGGQISYIKASKVLRMRSFVAAIKMRYEPEMEDNEAKENEPQVGSRENSRSEQKLGKKYSELAEGEQPSGPRYARSGELVKIEAVGMETIRQKQKISLLEKAVLEFCCISTFTNHPMNSVILPKLKEVSLCGNLLFKFSQLTDILDHLPSLETLNLSQNFLGLHQSDDLPAIGKQYEKLRVLAMNDCFLSHGISFVARIPTAFPNLQELYLSGNQLGSFHLHSLAEAFGTSFLFPRLLILDLSRNAFTSIEDVMLYSRVFPVLERLHLGYNPIDAIHISAELCSQIEAQKIYPELKALSLNNLQVPSLLPFLFLSKFTGLEELRLHRYAAGDTEQQFKMLRTILIANLSTLTVLNGSEVKSRVRTDHRRSFLYYLKAVASNGGVVGLLQQALSSMRSYILHQLENQSHEKKVLDNWKTIVNQSHEAARHVVSFPAELKAALLVVIFPELQSICEENMVELITLLRQEHATTGGQGADQQGHRKLLTLVFRSFASRSCNAKPREVKLKMDVTLQEVQRLCFAWFKVPVSSQIILHRQKLFDYSTNSIASNEINNGNKYSVPVVISLDDPEQKLFELGLTQSSELIIDEREPS